MLNEAEIDFAEFRANRKKRSLLVARHVHDHSVQASKRVTQRKLQLLEPGRVFFGIHSCGAERLVARGNFVAIVLENVERLRKLTLRDIRVNFREFGVAEQRHQLGFVHRAGFPRKAAAKVGDLALRDSGSQAQRGDYDERRKPDHRGQRYLFLFCSSRVRTRTRAVETKYISLFSFVFNCRNF